MAATEAVPTERTTSAALIAVAWLLVGLPLSWGVYKSALNVKMLFQPAAASATPLPASNAKPAAK